MMDPKQQPVVPDPEPFTLPSSDEIERLMQRGRTLRAEAMADLTRAVVDALRRAFHNGRACVAAPAADLRPQQH